MSPAPSQLCLCLDYGRTIEFALRVATGNKSDGLDKRQKVRLGFVRILIRETFIFMFSVGKSYLSWLRFERINRIIDYFYFVLVWVGYVRCLRRKWFVCLSV